MHEQANHICDTYTFFQEYIIYNFKGMDISFPGNMTRHKT